MWCSAVVRQRTTDFSSRHVECERIQPGLLLLSKRSLSTKPSIFDRIGLRLLARARYSSKRSFLGKTWKITENIRITLPDDMLARRNIHPQAPAPELSRAS